MTKNDFYDHVVEFLHEFDEMPLVVAMKMSKSVTGYFSSFSLRPGDRTIYYEEDQCSIAEFSQPMWNPDTLNIPYADVVSIDRQRITDKKNKIAMETLDIELKTGFMIQLQCHPHMKMR